MFDAAMQPLFEVILLVQGVLYRGWKSIEITCGMEQIAGSFDMTASDKWQANAMSWPIMPSLKCFVLIGPTRVITGYIDDQCPEYDERNHILRVTGRDATGDLVDCSAIYKSGQWKKAGLQKIATDLCLPYGISVSAETALGKPFDVFAIQDGESVYETLDRACRQRGVLPLSDGNGGLVLTRAGLSMIPTALVKGKNIERGAGNYSHKDRFSKYIVKGQAPGGDQYSKPEDHMQLKSEAEDSGVIRHRPKIIYAEQGDNMTYSERAKWERNVRAGRAIRVQYTVSGWEYLPTRIWQPNKMVMVIDDYLGIFQPLLITRCTYVLDDSGSRTLLELCPREAFELGTTPNVKFKAQKTESLV